MPRTRRLIPVDLAVHVICRGNNRHIVFNQDKDKLYYCKLLADFKKENKISIFHYCLMNNHVHLILWLNAQSKISKFIKQINLAYFHYYNKAYGYAGHFWQGRFKSNIIETDSYLLQCGKYIELNPVRAGIVNFPGEYRFSSYNYYAKGEYDFIVDASPAYMGLSNSDEERRERYIEFTIDYRIINSKNLNTGLFIGSEYFIKTLQASYKVNSMKLKRGRPKKVEK